MKHITITSPHGKTLSADEIRHALYMGLENRFKGKRLLVLIPDHTRTLPLPDLFRDLTEILSDTHQLDFLVASGTHPPLSDDRLNQLVGISHAERLNLHQAKGIAGQQIGSYPPVQLLNHAWDNPSAVVQIGTLSHDQVKRIAGSAWHVSLSGDIPVRINKLVLDYDHILILGPTFPHEVVGFSGGAKYLFPGISGPEMIHSTHWLGALSTVVGTIGIQDTPVRAMIHAAAEFFPRPVTLVALVVEGKGLAGMFIGDTREAWKSAAELSSQRHIRWVDKPYQKVLSRAPAMYDELWTAGKAMYKLEPAVAVGGEVVIFAPHLDKVSDVHGRYIYEIGYHILPYFLQDWEHYNHIPLGVLAHSTQLRGSGIMQGGLEKPNVNLILASQIPPEDCARLNLGYLDPSTINMQDYEGREAEGILYVPKAGEILYKTL
jgi:lactate racemase